MSLRIVRKPKPEPEPPAEPPAEPPVETYGIQMLYVESPLTLGGLSWVNLTSRRPA